MGMTGQYHAPIALYLGERTPDTRYPLDRRLGWAPEPVWTQGLEKKSSAPVGDRTPIVQPVVRHYTNWATLAPQGTGRYDKYLQDTWNIFRYDEYKSKYKQKYTFQYLYY
jgi:hypothetical protein